MNGIDLIKKMILQAIEGCTDIELLNFIYKLMTYDAPKTEPTETQNATATV